MFKPLPHQAVPVHHSSNPAERLAFWQAEFEGIHDQRARIVERHNALSPLGYPAFPENDGDR